MVFSFLGVRDFLQRQFGADSPPIFGVIAQIFVDFIDDKVHSLAHDFVVFVVCLVRCTGAPMAGDRCFVTRSIPWHFFEETLAIRATGGLREILAAPGQFEHMFECHVQIVGICQAISIYFQRLHDFRVLVAKPLRQPDKYEGQPLFQPAGDEMAHGTET